MGKYDCSKILDYVHEQKRLCNFHNSTHANCLDCVLLDLEDCKELEYITDESIKILQKWSDEHPEQTYADKFFEMFPNAPRVKMRIDIPVLCMKKIGWLNDTKDCIHDCLSCWNKPYEEQK